jgi:uncharacterized protein YutE (UPF0331/DUF86 family)
MNDAEVREFDILESIVPRFEAEGFEVFLNPSPSILPPFMQDYRPDAVALRHDKKIAIEVLGSPDHSKHKVRDLQSLFAPHRDWELRVFYVPASESGMAIDVASRKAILNSMQEVRELETNGHLRAALIMAWAALEALGRVLLPDQFRKSQTPARLIEVLASEGYLTPQEADKARAAIQLRNFAVHGGFDPVIDEKLVADFIAVLETVVRFLPKAWQSI